MAFWKVGATVVDCRVSSGGCVDRAPGWAIQIRDERKSVPWALRMPRGEGGGEGEGGTHVVS